MKELLLIVRNFISELEYTTVSLENEWFIELLFYDRCQKEKIIYGFLFSRQDNETVIDVGNISFESSIDNQLHLGCLTRIKEISIAEITSAIDIINDDLSSKTEKELKLNTFENVEETIKSYMETEEYTLLHIS
ncbi:MAG: hypothetical protein IJN43_10205 [Ruminococcus sp.]|nr:hypothetical protein [Ruminococcus sp.]